MAFDFLRESLVFSTTFGIRGWWEIIFPAPDAGQPIECYVDDIQGARRLAILTPWLGDGGFPLTTVNGRVRISTADPQVELGVRALIWSDGKCRFHANKVPVHWSFAGEQATSNQPVML